MFVNIVKILYKHLAPIVETVKRFGALFTCRRVVTAHRVEIYLVKFTHKQYWIAERKITVRLKQFINSHVFWTPQRYIVAAFKQVTVEEQAGTFVGKDNGDILQVPIESFIYIVGNEFKKWCHIIVFPLFHCYTYTKDSQRHSCSQSS